MSDIPDGFEEVIPDGFEEVQNHPSITGGLIDKLKPALGLPEAALSIASNIPAQINAWPAGIVRALQEGHKYGSPEFSKRSEEIANELIQQKTFEPRSEVGQRAMKEWVDPLMNNFLIPYGGIAHTMPPVSVRPGMPNAPKVPEKISKLDEIDKTAPASDIPPGFEEVQPGAKAFDQMRQTIDPSAPSPASMGQMPTATPAPWNHTLEQLQRVQVEQEAAMRQQSAARAQEAVEARQRALEEQVARQGGLDRNAAERARQEAAPVPGLEEARAREEAARMQEVQDSIDKTQDLNQRGQQMNIVEDYGNNDPMTRMPNMRVDENGIPIRADLSMEAQNLENPLQRNLWGDELGPALDQTKSLTEAIDSMPDLPWKDSPRDAAIDSLKGSVNATPDLYNAVNTANQQANLSRGMGRSQRGGLDFKAISDDAAKAIGALHGAIESITKKRIAPPPTAEDYIRSNIPGAKNVDSIPKFSKAEDVIAASRGTPDAPKPIWSQVQSGMRLTAEKYGQDPTLIGLARMGQYATKVADYQINKLVAPIEKIMGRLSGKDLGELMELMKKEQLNRKRYSEDQLRAAGFTDKQLNLYKTMRAAFDTALDLDNAKRREMGMKEVTPENAYFSSVWHGDWHMPIFDKEGNLAWYVRTPTRSEGKKALQYLKENFGDQLNLEKAQPEYRGNTAKPGEPAYYRYKDVPRDVVGAYQEMLKFFEGSPIADQIKASMEKYAQDKAYGAFGQDKHFLSKGNIRGFEGDQPWKSGRDNTYDAAHAQVGYLKNAIRWSHQQEAIAEMGKVLQDEQLLSEKPNIMQYARLAVDAQMGISKNLFSMFESELARLTGRSRSNLYGFTNVLKTGTYMVQLGFNIGFMMATPIQAAMMAVAKHAELSGQGYSHSALKTSVLGMTDSMAGLATHLARTLGEHTGTDALKNSNLSISKLGKEAINYAEDNGILGAHLFDENSGLGRHPVLQDLKNLTDVTISAPEKVARFTTFMGFVHHLEQSGKYANRAELFRQAEELTHNAVTDLRRSERPLIVDKLGVMGNLAYTYKSFLFNTYNQLHGFGREFKSGNPRPLLTALGGMLLMGGMMGLPGLNELDGTINLFKDGMAKAMPEHYADWFSGPGLRGRMMAAIPESGPAKELMNTAVFGLPSELTGTQQATRFSPQVLDVQHVTQSAAPVLQEAMELGSAGNFGLKALSGDTTEAGPALAHAVWTQMPPLFKGQMETRMDAFKGTKRENQGTQGYINPNDMADRADKPYFRTPDQAFKRSLGLTDLQEYRDKNAEYISEQEGKRLADARNGIADKMGQHLVVKLRDAQDSGVKLDMDKLVKTDPRMKQLVGAWARSGGDLQNEQVLQNLIVNKLMDVALTREERNKIAANTIEEINRYKMYEAMAHGKHQ